MLFQSQPFILGFLPPVLCAYYLVAGSRTLRQVLLVTASVFFYGWWDWRFVPLLAGLATATWLLAEGHRRAWAARSKLSLPLLGVALNLGTLILFKYADFVGRNLAWLFGSSWTP